MTFRDYENLSSNLADIIEYIKNQNNVITYYENMLKGQNDIFTTKEDQNAAENAAKPKLKPEEHMNVESPKSPKLETILKEKVFNTLYPKAKPGTYKALCDNLEKNHIDTPKRIAAFIAQCAHESGGFSVTSENLNYSEKALNTVFGKYFIRAGRSAAPYARNPEKIANIVYAGRMGNSFTGRWMEISWKRIYPINW